MSYNDFEIIAPKEIQVVKDYLMTYGAMYANMSGSGPAIVGVFYNKQKRLKAYKDLKKYFENYKAYNASQCKGVKILEKMRLN